MFGRFRLNGLDMAKIGGSLLMIIGLTVITFRFTDIHASILTLSWQKTRGEIISSTVVERTSSAHKPQAGQVPSKRSIPYHFFDPEIVYHYTVDGKEYQSNSIHAVSGGPFTQSSAQGIVNDYPVSSPVTVFYHPANPAQAALKRLPDLWALFFIALGLYLSGLGYLVFQGPGV